VNNNIVLIDTFNRLRREGMPPEQAAIVTVGQRIRPILLTTGTTILGLIPMMFMMNVRFFPASISFGGASSEWWVQLATAVVFGLGFSTLMILLITPVWLLVPTYCGRWWQRVRGKDTGSSDVRLIPPPGAQGNGEMLPAAE